MDYRMLGGTGIKVSRLCFGSLTIGPLQANMSIDEGSNVIAAAFERGVNFIDTAELYKTYPYICKAIKGRRQDIVISTKSYAYTKDGAEQSLMKALDEMNTDYIDIFSLHEQESEHTIRGHYDAIEYLIKAKEKGLIRSIGISTHAIAAVKASAKYREIEVIHPIINKAGLGIIDGSIEEMLDAVANVSKEGKGIYAMKALGGGNLLKQSNECFDFVLSKPYIDSVAVGMQSIAEVINNIMVFEGQEAAESIKNELKQKTRKLIVDFWCTGCGSCTEKCGQKAIKVINGKAVVDNKKCILCGYCSAHCPNFCLKII